MEAFFNPRSVAVIGASNSAFNLGASICHIAKYLKFDGAVYAVNRKGEEVMGCPGYASVLDIPGPVDLAVLITSAAAVPALADECGRKGVKGLVIESSGFSEEGGDGLRLQEELDRVARRHGLRYLGPNCLGVFNARNRFCCFYGLVPGMYDDVLTNPGTVSFIIQSGGIGALVIDAFQHDIVSVNKMVSIGNKADLDESDMIECLANDDTEVIALYLENVRDGRKLMEAARRTTKPILVFKVGRTEAGTRAALSHTAGMAGNDVIFDSACRQAGMVRLRSIDELHTLPKMFTAMPLLRGKRIAIITNSGAFGGITSDLAVEQGLEIARLSDATRQKLAATGKLFNTANPVDLGPAMSKKLFTDIFEILLASDEVDGLLPVPNVWQDVIVEAILDLVALCERYQKPAAIYIPNAVDRILAIRSRHRIPVFTSPEEAVRALAVSHAHHEGLSKKVVS